MPGVNCRNEPATPAKAAPYAIAALIAFALAWGIQSLRLTSAKLEVKEGQQEYTAFRQEQTRIFRASHCRHNSTKSPIWLTRLRKNSSQIILKPALYIGVRHCWPVWSYCRQ